MLVQPKIYVAGHQGMVGSAIVRTLQQQGQTHLVTRSHRELDLCDRAAVLAFFEAERRDQVYLAAAKPDGTPRKLMDSSRLNAMGWHAHIDWEQGLTLAYRDFLKNL